MASVKEKDSKVADAELSFLDLKDCSLETRTYLLALLEDESKPKTPPVQATSVTPSTPSISTSSEAEATSVTQAQQQQPAQHHFQQVYATPPTSQPYVYINNVTANVNVHHGAEQPQMKSMPVNQTVNSHSGSGFPPPPPNPMAFANPPVVSAPAAPIPNGIGIQQTPHAYLYHPQQIAALAAKAGAAQYMPPVIYYPYPIPVSQQTPPPAAPHPQTRGPQPNIIRNTTTSYPPNMVTSSNEVYYPQQIHATPLQTPVIPAATQPAAAPIAVASTAPVVVATSTPEEKRPIPREKEQPQKTSTVVTETENSVAKTLPPKTEKSEPTPPPATKKEVTSSDEIKPPVKAQQQQPAPQQQQAEKTPLKKEDSSASVNESEAAVKTPSGGGGGGGAPKSWASLFQKDTPANLSGGTQNKPTARIQPYTNVGDEGIEGKSDSKRNKDEESHTRSSVRHVNTNPNDLDMAKFLQAYALNHRSSMIKPRGLSNRNNWCFVNAILQAIVACPPFYNLMKSLPNDTMKRGSMVKVTKVVHDFVAEFSPLDHFPKINRRDKGKKNEDLPLGMTFEASSIFQFLLNLTSDTFKVEDGRQEDAEEFLTFLLNELNDEMLLLLKLLVENEEEEEAGSNAGENGEDEEDNDEWHEVGARNKSLLTRRVGNSNESLRSPVGCIFQGQLQSCVTSSNGEPTATLQPFFTLPLDIQSKNIKNVGDALLHNFTSETIDGYMCSKTNKQVEASRSLYLDELPSVLVLHLKRFIYDETSSGCQKLLKNIDFPVDLEIPKDILSNNSKNKYHNKQRSYKLFAVVYHNGKHASDGHYVTDVYHAGLGWLHCDDSLIKSMTETMVMAHSANSVPYILFYRRGDTMGPGPNPSGLNATK